jgi:uncharacterized repeat protein (TIGR01451 family)
MRRIIAIAGIGALGAILAGWAALAAARQEPRPPSQPAVPLVEPGPARAAALPPLPGAVTPTVEPGVPVPVSPDQPPVPPSLPPPPHVDEKSPVSPSPVQPPLPTGPAQQAPPALPSGTAQPTQQPPAPEKAGQATLPGQEGAPEAAAAAEDGPLVRADAAVSLEWSGPALTHVGQACDYVLTVRNGGNCAAQQLAVRVWVPQGVTVAATEPKADAEAGGVVWALGTLPAKQERALALRLLTETRGDVKPKAAVTFTSAASIPIRIREPRLALKVGAPERVLLGDTCVFGLTVSNTGDGPAEQVKVKAALSEGLEHARGGKFDFDIGTLAAGETRTVQLLCSTRAGGPQKCEATAVADAGLTANDCGVVNVTAPRLAVQMSGPAVRYLERRALYSIKVSNSGDAAAANVVVGDVVPEGFKVLAASDGGRHDSTTRTVSWFLGEIGLGQSREVRLEVQALSPGVFKHKATAIGARGLRAEGELTTMVEGLSALLLEMVDTVDPVEVGGDTAYEVRVTNTGSKAETDIRLVAVVPNKMEVKNVVGPARYRVEGKTIHFEPLDSLAPKANATFRVHVRALEPGTVRFRIQLTSTNLTEPVTQEEATRIYSDGPETTGKPMP